MTGPLTSDIDSFFSYPLSLIFSNCLSLKNFHPISTKPVEELKTKKNKLELFLIMLAETLCTPEILSTLNLEHSNMRTKLDFA